jgi:hypothetical protein
MFLNPWLLLGVSAVSVPIIIHLLNRRKYQRVVWAAMRFVLASLEKNQRRMRVEDLILLLLRCALLALLALALSRPLIRTAANMFGKQQVMAVVLLDNSLSMAAVDGAGGQARFDLAKKAADQVIDNLGNGSSVAVFLASDTARDVIAQPTFDLGLARQLIDQAPQSDRSSNMLAPLARAVRVLSEQAGAQKQIYVVTDGKAQSWRQGPEIRRLIDENRKEIGVNVVFVSDPAAAGALQNLAASRLHLTTELPTVNKALRFDVEVTNWSATEVHDVPVRLFVDDSPVAADEARIDALSPHQSHSIALNARVRGDGYHTITARLPKDQLSSDDARSMVVRCLKQVQVLLVDGDPGKEGRDAETFFLREALQPVDPTQRDKYFIQTRTIPIGDLGKTRLDDFDVVILANVPEIPRSLLEPIQRFLGNGRGLVIFPGPSTNMNFYNDVLYRQEQILPLPLGEPVGDSGQTEKFDTIQTGRFDHPITEFWNQDGAGNPAAAHFFRHFTLVEDTKIASTRPGTGGTAARGTGGGANLAAGPAAVVVRYAGGKAAVAEHTYGAGRVVLFSSTANTRWNDLPVRAGLFIPLMQRVVDSLLERQEERLTVQAGQKVAIAYPPSFEGKDAQITRPGQARNGAPDTARVARQPDGSTRLVFERTDLAGIYSVSVAGDAGAAAAGPVRFAVQTDPVASDLTPLSPEDQKQLAEIASVTLWKPGQALVSAGTGPQTGKELWFTLAVIVALMAALEMGLAFWFSRSK